MSDFPVYPPYFPEPPDEGGGSSGVQNPMTSDLDAGGFDINNASGITSNSLDVSAISGVSTINSSNNDLILASGSGAMIFTGIQVNLDQIQIMMSNIPTADPHISGLLWSNLGILTISAG